MKDKMITRTVSATIVKAMGINTASAQAITTEFTLTGVYKDSADMLKAINAQAEENVVYAAILSTTTKETLYGLPESVFLKYAQVLPPRGNKES